MITPTNVVRHELIGLHTKVVKSKNKANLNIEGKLVDETYKALVIEQKNKEKVILKDAVVVQLVLPDKKKVEVDGKLLVARPWDRIKKNLPKW